MLNASSNADIQSAAVKSEELVVLLHGLARSSRSMKKMQKALQNKGYTVLNLDYPSTKFPLETLSEDYLHVELQKQDLSQYKKINFVTHSMGGILIRYYLKRRDLPAIGRVVMLSPPNQGSELVDKLGGIGLFKWLNGPAGKQLGTADDSLPNQLGPVEFDLAVITGNRSLNPLYSWLIPGSDDGKVAVDRARVKGMKAFREVPSTHTFIMRNLTVIQLVIGYLENGVLVDSGQL
jgi:pimeloyl-ACP methyl ester carboxylesterase